MTGMDTVDVFIFLGVLGTLFYFVFVIGRGKR
jgi:hypothetical protein